MGRALLEISPHHTVKVRAREPNVATPYERNILLPSDPSIPADDSLAKWNDSEMLGDGGACDPGICGLRDENK